jgi:hypothetical protein
MFTHSLLKIRTAVFVSALALTASAPALHAQTSSIRDQMNVPFGFEVGSTHFAAGTYILSAPRENLLTVQGAKRTAFMISSYEINVTPSAQSKVIFDRYGNQYFLREVWTKNEAEHLRCPESKAEHEAKRMQRNDERASLDTHTRIQVALLEGPR